MKWPLVAVAVVIIAVVAWSYRSYSQDQTGWRFVRFAGAALLLITIFTHICEELDLFPFMGWGSPHTPGHYLDLASASIGITLLIIGTVGVWLVSRKAHVI